MKILLSFLLVAAAFAAVTRLDGGNPGAGGLLSLLLAAGLTVWPLTERQPTARRAPRLSAPRCAACGAR